MENELMTEPAGQLKEQVLTDKIDKKILYELHAGARISYAELGRKVRLSKQSVKERIRRLEREGVIKEYFTLIDIYRLGYSYYRLDFRFDNISPEKEQEIITFILTLPKVLWIAEIQGRYDLAVIFLTSDVVEIDNNIRELKWKFGRYIQKTLFTISTTHTRYTYRFLMGEKTNGKVYMGRERSKITLSPMEHAILLLLAQNARMPLVEIGQKLKKSVGSVKHTLNNLKREKIIVGYSALLNLQLLGYMQHKIFIILKEPNREKEKKIEYYFEQHPNIIFMTKSIGGADIECELVTQSIQEFKKIIHEIKHQFLDLVKDIRSYIVLEEYLTNYYPLR